MRVPGVAFALATTLLWAILPLSVAPLLDASDAVTISWFRFLSSGVLLWALLRLRGPLQLTRKPDRQLYWLLPLAVGALVANYTLYVTSLNYISPTIAAVVIQLAPVLLMLGSLYLFGERFVRIQWAGFAVMLAGMILFCWHRIAGDAGRSAQPLLGVLIIGSAALCWAVYGLAQKRLLLYAQSQTTMVAIYLSGAALMWPWSEPSGLVRLEGLELGLLLFLGFNTLVAYGCFAEALQRWEASKVSAVLATVPMLTLVLAWLLGELVPRHFGPEPLSIPLLLGAALVVAGSAACAVGPDLLRQRR